jgi:glyoxylase-like metal-dependent hydrolase (beta-lactamase superfamily II)
MSEIDCVQLKTKLEAGEAVEVVDIREPAEFGAWHIHGSRNLPVYDALRAGDPSPLVEQSAGLPKDRPLVAVCRAGVVSQRAADVLGSLGFEALSLSGGMRGWGDVWTAAPIALGDGRGTTLIQIRRNGKGCLSYIVGSRGAAVVVDPSADEGAYLKTADEAGLRITHVLETHVHADHVSRARALCGTTGAKLVLPVTDRVTYAYTPIRDGETLSIGDASIEALSTPGHTSESTCYLVDDELLLSGDTLFVNAVGRPDLEKGDAGAEAGARLLHGSLHDRLLARFDDVTVCPAHWSKPIGFDARPIAGSLTEIRSSLDLLRADEGGFVETVLASLSAKPCNHETIIALNEGKADLGRQSLLDLEAGPNSCAAG